jgi:phage shock protein E
MKKRTILTLVGLFLATPFSPAESTEKPTVIKEVKATEVTKLLQQNKKIIIIDLRRPEEFAQGHLPGAQNIDFQNSAFETQLAQLDRNQPYLFHCQSGKRSTASLSAWQKLGFTKLYHLKEGFAGWQKSQPQ